MGKFVRGTTRDQLWRTEFPDGLLKVEKRTIKRSSSPLQVELELSPEWVSIIADRNKQREGEPKEIKLGRRRKVKTQEWNKNQEEVIVLNEVNF